MSDASDQYRRIPQEEIEKAAESDPFRATAMHIANTTLGLAEQKAVGEKIHEPIFRDPGWHMALETPNGVVGLWSNWLGTQFVLGYPLDVEPVSDSVISETLGVGSARAVPQVDATVVEEGYDGPFKDSDKPLEESESGQALAYSTRGQRQWADFMGPKSEAGIGRVWVGHDTHHTSSVHFSVIDDNGEINDVYYGHDKSRTIFTFPHDFANKYAPDGPTNASEEIQRYRNDFLRLALKIARRMGGVEAVNVKYNLLVLVPEELERLGFENIRWINGQPGSRKGWGHEEVTADRGNEQVTLRSANEMVPWTTVRRISDPEEVAPEYLLSLLYF